MNWFERHLNWTVALVSAAYYLATTIIAIALMPAVNSTGDALGFLLFVSTLPAFLLVNMGEPLISLTGGFLIGFLVVSVCYWVLHQKSRSLWWLLLLLIPFGLVVPLLLENRSEKKALETKETESKANAEKEKSEILITESQEEEYKRSVWEIYRGEWATASPEKRNELNKRMLRWKDLMKNGWTASQAYIRAMEEESDENS